MNDSKQISERLKGDIRTTHRCYLSAHGAPRCTFSEKLGTCLLAYYSGNIGAGGNSIFIGYGHYFAYGCGLVALVVFCSEVAVGPGDRDSIVLTVVFLDALVEIVALDEYLGVSARIDAVVGSDAAEIVIQHVNFSNTCHGHTLFAASVPPVEGKSGIEIARRLSVAATNEVGVLVHVRAVGITEGTPADGIEIRSLSDIEITVHTVQEITMIHPAVSGSTDK